MQSFDFCSPTNWLAQLELYRADSVQFTLMACRTSLVFKHLRYGELYFGVYTHYYSILFQLVIDFQYSVKLSSGDICELNQFLFKTFEFNSF